MCPGHGRVVRGHVAHQQGPPCVEHRDDESRRGQHRGAGFPPDRRPRCPQRMAPGLRRESGEPGRAHRSPTNRARCTTSRHSISTPIRATSGSAPLSVCFVRSAFGDFLSISRCPTHDARTHRQPGHTRSAKYSMFRARKPMAAGR